PEATAPGLVPPAAIGAAPSVLPDASNACTGCNACNECALTCCQPRAPRTYGAAEYLMWWFKDSPQPVPLVTAVPARLVPGGGVTPSGAAVGSLLDPNAIVVLGGRDIDTGLRSGGRFTVGMWLDQCQRLGVEVNYFFIAPTTTTQTVGSNGSATSPLLS